MEKQQADFERTVSVTVSVHEQKCAGRYMLLLLGLALNITLNIPSAWPHLISIMGFVK